MRKIFEALNYGCEINGDYTNALLVSAATTFTSVYGLQLWMNFSPAKENQQKARIDTLLLSRTGRSSGTYHGKSRRFARYLRYHQLSG